MSRRRAAMKAVAGQEDLTKANLDQRIWTPAASLRIQGKCREKSKTPARKTAEHPFPAELSMTYPRSTGVEEQGNLADRSGRFRRDPAKGPRPWPRLRAAWRGCPKPTCPE